jgi:hypothetical protein
MHVVIAEIEFFDFSRSNISGERTISNVLFLLSDDRSCISSDGMLSPW